MYPWATIHQDMVIQYCIFICTIIVTLVIIIIYFSLLHFWSVVITQTYYSKLSSHYSVSDRWIYLTTILPYLYFTYVLLQ